MKMIITYTLLVGVPVAGVWSVLHLGGSLTPPRSVEGTWRVETVLQTENDVTCGTLAVKSFSISQSGPHLTVTFDDGGSLAGEISGDRIGAEMLAARPYLPGNRFP